MDTSNQVLNLEKAVCILRITNILRKDESEKFPTSYVLIEGQTRL